MSTSGGPAGSDQQVSVEVKEPTPFDPKESAKALIEEARSIQALLKTYEENTRQLQEDVNLFVARDADEQLRFNTISTTVARSEMNSLQNTDYIKYTRFFKEKDVDSEVVMPTSRMRGKNDGCEGERNLREVPWACCSCFEVSHWLPDSAVALKGYGDVREVLLGWRSKNENSTIGFMQMSEGLYNTAHGKESMPYVCFFNGNMFCPRELQDTRLHGDNISKELRSNNVAENPIGSAVQTFTDFTVRHSALNIQQFQRVLWNEASSAHTDTTGGQRAEQELNNFTPQLFGDVHDNLILIKPERMHNTQHFRGFFIRGQLIAVEHIGTPVDAIRLLYYNPDAEEEYSYEREKARIAETFRLIYSYCGDSDGTTSSNVAIILAIKSEPLSSGPGVKSHREGVLLDLRPISPSLPFCWHLTWAELCALGQLSAGPENCVAFKVTKVSVSALEPYDTLSRLYFPFLNRVIADVWGGRAQRHRDCSDEHGTNMLARVSGAVTVASAGAMAALWLLKRK